jgi:methionyl-tRNA synthetase
VEPEDSRTQDEIKKDYDEKVEEINKEKAAIKQKIEELKKVYNKEMDAYEEYSELVDYIKMVREEK